MNDVLTTILYGIISSIIAAIIIELARKNSSWIPSPSENKSLKNTLEPIEQNDVRSRNKEKLNRTFFNMFFYFYTFMLLYLALLMPPLLKGGLLNKGVVYLDDAKFIGTYLPHILIQSNIVQSVFIGIAIIFYLPLLLIVNKSSLYIALIVDKFKLVDFYEWRRIQTLIFMIFSSIIAILSIWLYNEMSIGKAFSSFLTFIFLGFVLASGRR